MLRDELNTRGARGAACADGLAFIVLALWLCWRGLSIFDTNWDSLAYHLPFAGMRVGLVPQGEFTLPPHLVSAYSGFPPGIDYIKGALWLATGSPNAGNIINVLGVSLLSIYLRVEFKISLAVSFLGLLAIPVVLTGLNTNYTDVVSNVAFVIAVVAAAAFFAADGANKRRHFIVMLLGLAAAANSKPQFVVLAGMFAGGVLLALTVQFLRTRDLVAVCGCRAPLAALIVGLALVGIYWVPVHNLIVHANPLYPMGITIGPLVLPGDFSPGNWREPLYSEHFPQPVRWMLSVLEFRSFDYRPIPYMLGQGDVPAHAMSMRMGGYLFPYMVACALNLLLLSDFRRNKFDRYNAIFFAVLTIVAALLPGSHELRYYMFWAILLVVYAAICSTKTASVRARTLAVAPLLCAFLYVNFLTGFVHLLPRASTPEAAITGFGVRAARTAIPQGAGDVCLLNWGPAYFLFSDVFYTPAERRPDLHFKAALFPEQCKGADLVVEPAK